MLELRSCLHLLFAEWEVADGLPWDLEVRELLELMVPLVREVEILSKD
jgi:hypothetical protein